METRGPPRFRHEILPRRDGPMMANEVDQVTGIALTIGLNHVGSFYQGGAPVLHGCANDARAIAALCAKQGFGEPTVLIDRQATVAAVTRAISAAAAVLKPGDLFVIHYSGHGMQGDLEGNADGLARKPIVVLVPLRRTPAEPRPLQALVPVRRLGPDRGPFRQLPQRQRDPRIPGPRPTCRLASWHPGGGEGRHHRGQPGLLRLGPRSDRRRPRPGGSDRAGRRRLVACRLP